MIAGFSFLIVGSAIHWAVIINPEGFENPGLATIAAMCLLFLGALHVVFPIFLRKISKNS